MMLRCIGRLWVGQYLRGVYQLPSTPTSALQRDIERPGLMRSSAAVAKDNEQSNRAASSAFEQREKQAHMLSVSLRSKQHCT